MRGTKQQGDKVYQRESTSRGKDTNLTRICFQVPCVLRRTRSLRKSTPTQAKGRNEGTKPRADSSQANVAGGQSIRETADKEQGREGNVRQPGGRLMGLLSYRSPSSASSVTRFLPSSACSS